MTKAWALALVAMVLMAPVAAAKSQPAVLFLADGDTPAGPGALRSEWPEGNVSSLRLVTPAPSPELLVSFAANQTGGTRLYGPAFTAIWPDKALAENGTVVRAALRIDGEVVAEQSLPIVFDPASAPDPLAFIPPDPTDPQGAVFHVVGQALPLVYTPGALLYFGFLDLDVPDDAVVSITYEVVAGGALPVGSVLMKYDSILTPSYVYMPWWVPDPEPTSTPRPTSTFTRTATPTDSPSPSPTIDADEKDSPTLPVVGVVAMLGLLALRRRL